MQSNPDVYFLYRAGHVNTGSKIMRCDQLCEIAKKHLGERFNFYTKALPRPKHLGKQRKMVDELQNSIVIFLKRADLVFDIEILADLRKSVKGMAIDYVDSNMFPLPQVEMDVHISASIAGKQALDVLLSGPFGAALNDRTAAHVVLHHADPRILPARAGGNRLKLSYFGRPSNAYLPEFAQNRISNLTYNEANGSNFVQEMQKYNMHYCVREIGRSNLKLAYKPFTKGFNASASRVNVIVNRQVPDAIAFLGEDYPFLIDDSSEKSLLSGLETAQAAIQTTVWSDGLERMEYMRSKIAPKEIARQLEGALEIML